MRKLISCLAAFALTACADDGGGGSPPGTSTNLAPIADAGADQSVNEGAPVTIDGAASRDPDGSIVSYAWVQTSGPAVAVSNTVTFTFTAPSVDTAQTLVFTLTVRDNAGATSTDSVAVTVNPLSATVGTTSGFYQGDAGTPGVVSFKGMRYAAPPTGPRRWRAPENPTVPPGVVPALAFGAICPQLANPIAPGGAPPGTQDEDCLFLNVWTPSVSQTANLAVMVWIHGGGFNTGSSTIAAYDGASFARDQNVVLVSVNYRLGPFGFIAHPQLRAESAANAAGNYGLMDLIKALEWVRDNIRGFGGDPARVTIFGESAGAVAVCHLVASPPARGLFLRGIMQSGACAADLLPLDVPPLSLADSGLKQGLRAQGLLSCNGASDPLACMRGKSVAEIFTALAPATSQLFQAGENYAPIVDGAVLTGQPLATLQSGAAAPTPLLIGSNDNEIALWRPLYQAGVDTLVEYLNYLELLDFDLNSTLDFPSAQLLALYPAATDGEALPAFERFRTDITFVCPVRRSIRARTATGVRAYLYDFARVPPLLTSVGAVHAAEIAYVFNNVPSLGYVAADRALATSAQSYWANFAKFGDPNAGTLVAWPEYALATDRHLELDAPITDSANLRKAACDFLDTL